MNIEIIRDREGFQRLKGSWDGMVARCSSPNVFQCWDWLAQWLESFGCSSSLFILVAKDAAGECVAAAPLEISRRAVYGVECRCAGFMGTGHGLIPDHLGFISRGEDAGVFSRGALDILTAHRGEWDAVRLTDMREDSELVRSCRCAQSPLRVRIAERGVCPYIMLPFSWEQYVAGLSSRGRRNVGQFEREMEKRFTVRYSMCERPDELGPLMGELEDKHRKRMAVKGHPASEPSLQPEFWEFHRRFALRMLGAGRLFMGALRLNGEVAACQYGFGFAGRVSMYQSGLDPRFSRHSAGFVLYTWMIREAIRRGFREFDFLRGDERYKFHFTKLCRRNMEMTVLNRTLAGTLAGWGAAVASAAKRMAGRGGQAELAGIEVT